MYNYLSKIEKKSISIYSNIKHSKCLLSDYKKKGSIVPELNVLKRGNNRGIKRGINYFFFLFSL